MYRQRRQRQRRQRRCRAGDGQQRDRLTAKRIRAAPAVLPGLAQGSDSSSLHTSLNGRRAARQCKHGADKRDDCIKNEHCYTCHGVPVLVMQAELASPLFLLPFQQCPCTTITKEQERQRPARLSYLGRDRTAHVAHSLTPCPPPSVTSLPPPCRLPPWQGSSPNLSAIVCFSTSSTAVSLLVDLFFPNFSYSVDMRLFILYFAFSTGDTLLDDCYFYSCLLNTFVNGLADVFFVSVLVDLPVKK